MLRKVINFIFAFVFLGVAVGFFIGFVLPQQKIAYAAKNGTPTVGYVVDVDTNTTVNGEQKFHIAYRYDANGVEKSGKTPDAYTIRELANMGVVNIESSSTYSVNIGFVVEVKYTDNASSVVPYKSGSPIPTIMAGVFGAIGILLVVIFCVQIANGANHKKIMKRGTDATATYLSDHPSSVVTNGHRLWILKYSFVDSEGNTQTKTKKVEHYEADILRQLKEFPIKILGKKTSFELNEAQKTQALKATNSAQNIQSTAFAINGRPDIFTNANAFETSQQNYKSTVYDEFTGRPIETNDSQNTRQTDFENANTNTVCPHCGSMVEYKKFCSNCGGKIQ